MVAQLLSASRALIQLYDNYEDPSKNLLPTLSSDSNRSTNIIKRYGIIGDTMV